MAFAQDLRLFEEPQSQSGEQAIGIAPPLVAAGNGQPAYTLRSISRFGDRYEAVLLDRGGQPVKARWNVGSNASIPNSGVTIVGAGPGTVSLMHPPGDNCIAAPPAVACSEPNRSELRLALAAPLASNGVPPAALMGPQQQMQQGGAVPPADPFGAAAVDGQQVFINPFSGEPEVMPQVSPEELAARQQRQELRAARLRQFETQQRIDDSQIPPGMQRVRTPFGDQLIPIRE